MSETKRRAPPNDDDSDFNCEQCSEATERGDLNIEAWELTGMFLCPDCANELFEDSAAMDVELDAALSRALPENNEGK